MTILTHEGVEESARAADVLVAPAVGDVDLLDFDAKDRAIAAGAAAAREKLLEIRNAVEGVEGARSSPQAQSLTAHPRGLPDQAAALRRATRCIEPRSSSPRSPGRLLYVPAPGATIRHISCRRLRSREDRRRVVEREWLRCCCSAHAR